MGTNPIQPGGNKSPRDVDRLASKTRSLWSRTYVFIKKANVKTWKKVFALAFITGVIAASGWMIALKVQTMTWSAGDAITIRAKGTLGDEKIDLRINGVTKATWKLSTAYNNYSVAATASSSDTVRVYFINDNGARDVQLDYIIVNGTTLQAEAQVTNTAFWNTATQKCGGSNSEQMGCNGYIQFKAGSAPPSTGNIVVRAKGAIGGETIDLRINGTIKATWKLSTVYNDYSVAATASSADTVRVYFTNDNSTTRDVQLDYIIINGTTYQAEVQVTNTAFWNTATKKCGGSNSELMGCNGYIEFKAVNTSIQSCGDNSCNSGETCSTCPGDCGNCQPTTVNCLPAPASTTVVSVRDTGATINDSTNDTKAIQAAVDQVAGTGGTVYVPDGTYIIDALTSIKLKSNMTLKMSGGAVLKAIPNNQTGYAIIQIQNASNVNVAGGTILGERNAHQGTDGQWGMGIRIGGVNNAVISGVTIKDAWGDGIYINGMSKGITLCSVVADNNRRQGLSIVSADGVVIKNSVFKNTHGHAPEAGIDLEPNPGGVDSVKNVQILNSHFLNNNFVGIDLMAWAGPVSNVTIQGNTIEGNGGGILVHKSNNNKISTNIITDDSAYGISLQSGSTGNVITGNTITVTAGAAGKGIVGSSSGNTINSNTIK